MSFQIKSIKSHTSLSELAYESIKKSILATDVSRLKEDTRLDEKTLIESLGISRTPVREAISRLSAEGFLKVVPRIGVFVARKSEAEIIETQLVRSVLEGLASRLATKNFTRKDIVYMRSIFAPFEKSNLLDLKSEYSLANIRFHEFILQISECGKLIEFATNLADHARMIRFRTSSYGKRLESSLAQHLELIDTFEKGDAELAEKLMHKHIDESMQYLSQQIRKERKKLAAVPDKQATGR